MIQATIAIDLTTGSALQGAIFVYECPQSGTKKAFPWDPQFGTQQRLIQINSIRSLIYLGLTQPEDIQ